MAANGGTSSLLANLPSRGLFSSSILYSKLNGARVYICTHDTSPPEEQVIKTNGSNILIRCLQISKERNESKDASKEKNKGKRSAGKTLEEKTPTKRAKNGISGTGQQEGSSSGFSETVLQAMTVDRLRALLKERGLPIKGRKDQLVSRLRDAT